MNPALLAAEVSALIFRAWRAGGRFPPFALIGHAEKALQSILPHDLEPVSPARAGPRMAAVDHSRRDPQAPGRFEKPLWTAHDVADLLGVSHEYVWQLSREGRIPTVALGRTRRYRRDSILAWLEQIESPGGRA